LGYDLLKIAKLCAKVARWVTGNVGNLGILAVQRLLSRQKICLTESKSPGE
jgi:hypothetical protein